MAPWFKAIIATAALAGCAPLTAEEPLFSPADQLGPAPLTEGVWIQIGEDCPARMARRRGRLPAACAPGELRRLLDGAWQFHVRTPARTGAAEPERDEVMRLVLAAATERPNAETYAPLYLAEYLQEAEPRGPRYLAIAPIGVLPATEIYVVALDCGDVLRDGPIAGVREVRDETGKIVSCIAASQAAVREAARRAIIENLGQVDETRLMFVRP